MWVQDVSVFIWLTFPADTWPGVPPCFSLLKVYKSGPSYGVLCSMTCRRSFSPRSLALLHPALPAQHFCSNHTVQAMHRAQSQQQPVDGAGVLTSKGFSTATWQGNEGGDVTRIGPHPLRNGY